MIANFNPVKSRVRQKQNFCASPLKVQVRHGSLADVTADIVVLNLFRGTRTYAGATGAINDKMGGALARALEAKRFMGEFGETMIVPTAGKLQAPQILLIGLGKKNFFGLGSIEKISAQVIKRCESIPRVKNIATLLHGAGCGGLTPKDCAKALTKGAVAFEGPKQVEALDIVEFDSSKIAQIEKGIQEGM